MRDAVYLERIHKMWTEKHKLWIGDEDNPQNMELNQQNVDFDLENDGLCIVVRIFS